MESNISPRYYFDAEIFEAEKEKIFRRTWAFVGFKNQLARPNDFLTLRVGEVPVVVQNVQGEIVAFLNVCSHRFSIIQTQAAGSQPLMCPYHGWSYDGEGTPTGIPKRPLFKDFTHDELRGMRLRKYRTEFCGNMVFVSLADTAQDLSDFLGEFYEELASISNSLGDCVDVNELQICANWKVVVENALEGYHVTLIHANTIKKLGGKERKFDFSNCHSRVDSELVNRNAALGRIESMFDARSYSIDGYRHFLVFPNLLVSTTHGTSFNFSMVEPLTPAITKFTSHVYTAVVREDANKSLLNAYGKTLAQFNRDVFSEDKAICETVQLGVRFTPYQGMLSEEEGRVHAFQKNYIGGMGND